MSLTREQRATHVYMTGATGTGKSKLLEHLIRQDIRQWHKSRSGMLVMGKELSSVQFEPVEEQIFRAMAVLHDQKQRHFVARLSGSTTPFAVRTADVKKPVFGVPEAREHVEKLLKNWAFAIPSLQARKHVKERAAKLRLDADSGEQLDEPATSRRKIR